MFFFSRLPDDSLLNPSPSRRGSLQLFSAVGDWIARRGRPPGDRARTYRGRIHITTILRLGMGSRPGKKVALHRHRFPRLALPLTMCHFPPGTSKWNKIEHRLFSFITSNWRGQPLISHQAIVELIASTTTRSGLIVRAYLDSKRYSTHVKVSDEQLARVRLKPHDFHGDWNYTVSPRCVR